MADTEGDFNIFVGTETGLLKGVSVNPKSNIAKNFHNLKNGLSREEEITCMSWGDQNEILLGLRNQTVKIFDTSDKCFVGNIDVSSQGQENFGPLRGVDRVDGAILTAAESGTVTLWRDPAENRLSFNTIDVELNSSGKLKKNDFETEEAREKHLVTLKAGRSLCKLRTNKMQKNLIATGGKENDVQLWDLNRPEEPVFRAKNVKPDFLELRVPVWVNDLCFPDPEKVHSLATVNRHGQIRLYDTRKSSERRRPIMELTFPDETLTAICPVPNPNQVGV